MRSLSWGEKGLDPWRRARCVVTRAPLSSAIGQTEKLARLQSRGSLGQGIVVLGHTLQWSMDALPREANWRCPPDYSFFKSVLPTNRSSGIRLLNVDTSRVRAATAAVARARAGAASVAVAAGVVRTARRVAAVIGTHVSAMHESDNRGNGKEDDVHNAKCPAGLEHGAWLVVDEVIAGANDPYIASGEVPVVATSNANTVGVAHIAQVVNGGNEGAEEQGINECDKVGVCRRAVVAEEGEDCPSKRENRDNEENED